MLSDRHKTTKKVLKRYRIDERIFTLLVAALIGLLSGYGAVLFRLMIKVTQYAFYRNTSDILTF